MGVLAVEWCRETAVELEGEAALWRSCGGSVADSV